jgi:exonuclease SbcC
MLSPAWRKMLIEEIFAASVNKNIDHNRQLKTLELEILAGLDSPKEFAQQRMQIQVKLMQDKMTSGVGINLEQSFNEWLSQGAISKDDLPLILRVKPIFCH